MVQFTGGVLPSSRRLIQTPGLARYSFCRYLAQAALQLGLRPCCWLMSGPAHLPTGKGQSVGPVGGMGDALLAPLVLVSISVVPTETWD